MITAKTGPRDGFASQCPADCGARFLTYDPLSTKVNERSSFKRRVRRSLGVWTLEVRLGIASPGLNLLFSVIIRNSSTL